MGDAPPQKATWVGALHMFLGNRLEAALSILMQCGKQNLFADIGSDHAYLAIEAMARGLAVHAVASDINPAPLESGRENAAARGIFPDFLLSDGFDALESLPIDSAAICGMGGELMAVMIDRSSVAKKVDLILQPMSKTDSLRAFLWSNGYEILSETFVSEGNKPYVIIRAKYTGKNTQYSVSDTLLGKICPETDAFSLYFKKVMHRLKKQLDGLKKSGGDTAAIKLLIDACQKQKVSR